MSSSSKPYTTGQPPLSAFISLVLMIFLIFFFF